MPNPPCERSRDRSACVNRSKTRGSISGAMPTPVSRTRSTASSPSCWTSQPDVTALVGVLGGVGEQVHHHLFQPGSVGVQPDRLRRQRHREFMLALVDQRADRRHRIFHDDSHGDPFSVKLNPTGGNARNFEQIINDLCQLSHLPLNDGGRLLEDRVLDAVQTIPVVVQAKEMQRH